MAFSYDTGTANDVPDFFSKLEAFLTAAGWSVISGAGTTTIVFKSPGEEGGREKLYIRFRRDSVSGQYVYFRVQDDAAGTHATSENTITYPGCMSAPGTGESAFTYWICADKNMASVAFKSGASYSGCYVGILARFALTVDGEEYEMAAVGLHTNVGGAYYANTARMLRNYAGTWDAVLQVFTVEPDHRIDPVDNSYAVHASIADQGANVAGELYNVSARVIPPVINPEDRVTTGFTGATTTWIVLGTGNDRWAIRTGGVVPIGTPEGAHFAHTVQLASTIEDCHSKLFAFLEGVGWTVANRSPKIYAVDKTLNCAGEAGEDDIWLRWWYDDAGLGEIHAYVMDNVNEDHKTATATIPGIKINFPTYFYASADRDCFTLVIEITGSYTPGWFGMFKTFLPDPGSVATPYKVGWIVSTQSRLLRNHAGTWGYNISEFDERDANSSPNSYDGKTFIPWPYTFTDAYWPLGSAKYLYRCASAQFSVLDTVAVGGRVYRYFGGSLVMRVV